DGGLQDVAGAVNIDAVEVSATPWMDDARDVKQGSALGARAQALAVLLPRDVAAYDLDAVAQLLDEGGIVARQHQTAHPQLRVRLRHPRALRQAVDECANQPAPEPAGSARHDCEIVPRVHCFPLTAQVGSSEARPNTRLLGLAAARLNLHK